MMTTTIAAPPGGALPAKGAPETQSRTTFWALTKDAMPVAFVRTSAELFCDPRTDGRIWHYPDPVIEPVDSGAICLWGTAIRGVAPDSIVATGNRFPATVGPYAGLGNTTRSRPLCAYPKVAVYDGSGSTDDEANFKCRTPRHGKDHDDRDRHDRDHDDDED